MAGDTEAVGAKAVGAASGGIVSGGIVSGGIVAVGTMDDPIARMLGRRSPQAPSPLPPLTARLQATLPVARLLTRAPKASSEKNLLLFSQSRCGSTLLMDLLNSHPDVDCRNEIYIEAPFFPVQLRRSLERGRRAAVFGFKLQVHQFDQKVRVRSPKAFVEQLVDDGYTIVYLRRSNVLRHALSEVIRSASGLTHVRSDAQAETVERASRGRVVVDISALRTAMEVREYYWEAADAILDGLPHLDVEYGRDLLEPDRHQTIADAVFAALGLGSAKVSTKLRRINAHTVPELVENHAELSAALEGTRWQTFLDA